MYSPVGSASSSCRGCGRAPSSARRCGRAAPPGRRGSSAARSSRISSAGVRDALPTATTSMSKVTSQDGVKAVGQVVGDPVDGNDDRWRAPPSVTLLHRERLQSPVCGRIVRRSSCGLPGRPRQRSRPHWSTGSLDGHQFHSPSSTMVDGTSSVRTRNVEQQDAEGRCRGRCRGPGFVLDLLLARDGRATRNELLPAPGQPR